MDDLQNKRCTKCEEIKLLSEFHKRQSMCKTCRKDNDRLYRIKNIEKISIQRKGRYILNRLDDNWIEKERKRSVDNHKKFHSRELEYAREYREKNKKDICERQRKFYENNKEKILNYHHCYYKKNRDLILCKNKQYREINRDKRLNYAREFRNKNRDKLRRDARLRAAEYRKSVSDVYIRSIFFSMGIFEPETWIVEVKRQQILLNRKLKNKAKEN